MQMIVSRIRTRTACSLDVMRVDAEQRILILIVALIALMSLGIGMMLPMTFPGLFS